MLSMDFFALHKPAESPRSPGAEPLAASPIAIDPIAAEGSSFDRLVWYPGVPHAELWSHPDSGILVWDDADE